MSETKGENIQRIAVFLNGFLGKECLQDLQYPDYLLGDYDEFDEDQKADWFEWTYSQILLDIGMGIGDILGRSFNNVETGLVRRRIILFLNKNGYSYARY